jgi:putative phosphoesterase
MKLLIASDIHGDLESCQLVLKAFVDEGCDRLLFLGDLLYHGPRNDLPKTYAPKAVIELLNAKRDVILSDRGNCDTEVDQMVLNFPILADYAYLDLDGLSVFATHGHHHNTETPPPLREGEILLHGHTHVLKCVEFRNKNFYLNPGSAALPKEGNPRTYMIYESRTFTVKTFDGKTVFEKSF